MQNKTIGSNLQNWEKQRILYNIIIEFGIPMKAVRIIVFK